MDGKSSTTPVLSSNKRRQSPEELVYLYMSVKRLDEALYLWIIMCIYHIDSIEMVQTPSSGFILTVLNQPLQSGS